MMKNLLFFLFLLGICQGSVVENLVDKSENVTIEVVEEDGQRSSENTLRPTINYSVLDGPPLQLSVAWTLLPSPPLNPIRGYEVKLWEQRTRIVHILENVNGTYVVVGEREEPVPMPSGFNELPDWTPREVRTVPSTINYAVFGNLKYDLWYEIRVRAFTLDGFSQYSDMRRYLFHSKN